MVGGGLLAGVEGSDPSPGSRESLRVVATWFSGTTTWELTTLPENAYRISIDEISLDGFKQGADLVTADLSNLGEEDELEDISGDNFGKDELSQWDPNLPLPPDMISESQPVESGLEAIGNFLAHGGQGPYSRLANQMANDYLGANVTGTKPALSESDKLPSVKPVLIPEDFPLFDEFARTSSGASVTEPDSVAWENGRTYHGYKEGKYYLPNDAKEQDRLDVQHAGMLLLLDGKLAVAPLAKEPGSNLLDVATGTGIWALEYGRRGRPEEFGDIRFDYIHLRFVVTCFNDHHGVLSQAFNHLKPGGWIEYQDTAPVLMSPHPEWQ
ncbi:S-adenosylmethionine-dependent methyltransferase, partial [Apiospora hydei]